MTLRTKASLLISLIIIIVMGAFGIYYLQFMQRSLKYSIFAGIQGTSDAASQGISKFFADSLKETEAVALALPVEALEKKDTPVIRDRLKSLLNLFPKFENGIFLLDKDGFLWVDYPQFGVIGADFSYREYFQRTLKEGKGIIGFPYVSNRTGKPVLTFTALLRGSKNQVLGVLGCSVQLLSPDALGGIRKIKIGKSGYIYVFNTSRLMILHPENQRVLKWDIPLGANKLLDAAIEGFEGVGETVNSRGVPMLTAFKRITGTDWIIGAQQPQEEAYLPIAKARYGLILSIILMVVVAVVSVAMAIRRITLPLTKLRQAVMLWGKGKSAESEKVAKELEKIRGSDEIGTLAKAFLDISKQLDETLISLKSANTYLENIFANSADSIAIVDLESKFTRWNKTAEEIYGYTFEEIKDISEIGLYADPEEYYAMLKQLRQHDFIRNYEINMKKKDGSVFPASLSIRFLRDTDNEIIGSITGSRDLSEIKLIMMHLKNEIYQHEQARQAMLDVEQKLANIIDFLPDATFVIDKKGKVMAWNKAIEEMTGVSAKDMVGKGNYEYALPFYGERRPILIDLVLEPDGIEKYAEVKREDQALMIVNHFNNFRGKETYLFGKASALIDLHGNIIGSIETIRDITALRKAETDRLQFSKLESLSILAGGIAHDFNNILAAILGNISLAMLEQNMGEQGRQRLTAAEKACLQAQNLAGQLLTFAKGGAPIKKLISLESLVAEAASLACRGSQVRCEYGFAQDLLAIAGDPGQINQVFQNLIINAFQAMPGGGTVRIQGENVKIGEKSELPLMAGNYVKTSIQDHGSGIPKKYLQRIFDPYFTTKQQGSGLGLATAYSIITNHHGQISVESRLGEGTTFHVYLPASDQKITQQPEETTELLTGKGKILVMDDEAMVREVLGAMLPTLGYEAEVAKDGVEAIELFSQAQGSAESFAAVILDLTVPAGMGGKETIEKLLKIDPQVKAIVSSGYSDDPIMADFQEYGFIAVIAKPYKVAELGKVLNHALIGNE